MIKLLLFLTGFWLISNTREIDYYLIYPFWLLTKFLKDLSDMGIITGL